MLQAWVKGDLEARDRLLPIVYRELRRQAAGSSAASALDTPCSRPPSCTRSTCVSRNRGASESRAEFFAAAAEAMRRILVDQARKRAAAKRAGD